MATILIVDDRESNRELLTTLLGYRNHRTVEASDGAEGLERARIDRPDLIITDILMPTMDGYEFTRRLRADPAFAATPVVFYSAHYLMQEARTLAAKCGVEYVVAKPAEPEELLRTVDAALGLAPAAVPSTPVEEFDREHIRVLTDKLSQQTGEVGNLSARLEALIDVGRELNVAQDTSVLLERYCRAAREVVGAVCSAACITDERGRATRRYRSAGVKHPDPECACPTCGLGGPVAGLLRDQSIRRGRHFPGDVATLGCSPEVGPVDSYLVVPILTRSQTYGWLGLGNKLGASECTADDERLLTTLAAQFAVGYENSRLFKELKQRAEELAHEVVERRQAAEKYRMVVEQASDGIAIADEQGDCLEANTRLLEMLGYRREELLRRNMQDLLPREDRNQIPWSVDQIRGKIFRKELRFLHRDGSPLEVEVSMSGLEDGRMQAIVRDVAERKHLEARLRQAQKLEAVGRLAGGVAHDFNNLLTVILGHSDLVLSAMDPHDCRRHDIEDIRDAGARAAVLTNQLLAFSRKREKLSGQSIETLLPDQFRHLHARHRVEYFDHPKVRPMGAGLELKGRRKDGSEFPVEISLSPIETEEGLQVIGKHLLALINDVLDLAKVESGAIEIERTETSCREVLKEVEAVVGPIAEAKSVALEVDLPEPTVMIRTRQLAFTQILITLARQAVKYSERGTLRIGTSEASRDSQDLMAVYVKPTAGLKPKDQEWIRQVFERVRQGEHPEGSELSLYLCGRLADLIGGSVEVESEAEDGSQFTLLVPNRTFAVRHI
jgi:PAS domain S-box-containing protein